MKAEGVARALMVVQANLTPFAKQCLTEMQPKYNIEVVRYTPDIACPVYLALQLQQHILSVGEEHNNAWIQLLQYQVKLVISTTRVSRNMHV